MAKVEHDRETCIGCGACIAVHPTGWKMADDGKTDIKGGTKRADGWEEKEIDETYEQYKESAESCPVNCIHLTDNDGNKTI